MDGHGGPRAKNGPALAGHGAEAVRDAIASSITTLPEQLRKSLTWDQGAEMAQHPRLRIDTGIEVYFCDPHSPWCCATASLVMGAALLLVMCVGCVGGLGVGMGVVAPGRGGAHGRDRGRGHRVRVLGVVSRR
jgi:hypothetical protein